MTSTITDERRNEVMQCLLRIIGPSGPGLHYADDTHALQPSEDDDERMELESEDDDQQDDYLRSLYRGCSLDRSMDMQTSWEDDYSFVGLRGNAAEKLNAPLAVRPHLPSIFSHSDTKRLATSDISESTVEDKDKKLEAPAPLSTDEDGDPRDHESCLNRPVAFDMKTRLESRYAYYGLRAREDENFGDVLLPSRDRAPFARKLSNFKELKGLSDSAPSESMVEGKGKGREIQAVPKVDSEALLKYTKARLEYLRAQQRELDALSSSNAAYIALLLGSDKGGDSDMDEDYHTASSSADMDEDAPPLEQGSLESSLYPFRRFLEPEFVEGPSSFTLDDLRKQNKSWY